MLFEKGILELAINLFATAFFAGSEGDFFVFNVIIRNSLSSRGSRDSLLFWACKVNCKCEIARARNFWCYKDFYKSD